MGEGRAGGAEPRRRKSGACFHPFKSMKEESMKEGLKMYYLTEKDRWVIDALRRLPTNRVLIIFGPPGTGKTSLGSVIAQEFGYAEEYYLCVADTTWEDLILAVDPSRVAAVAAGLVSSVDCYVKGPLLRAVEKSRREGCVLLLDELDKARERVDAYLLDFLQNGRIVDQLGRVWVANMAQLVVIITSNGQRPLNEALLRRGMRYWKDFLPPAAEIDILRKKTGAPTGFLRALVSCAAELRRKGVMVSIYEMERFTLAARAASTKEEFKFLFECFLLREAVELSRDWPAILWGELKR